MEHNLGLPGDLEYFALKSCDLVSPYYDLLPATRAQINELFALQKQGRLIDINVPVTTKWKLTQIVYEWDFFNRCAKRVRLSQAQAQRMIELSKEAQ